MTSRNISRKLMPEMISLCMVVRNEEKILGESLNDIKDSVQEIIIVDQSSTDNTVNIASRFTRNVFIRPDSGFCDTDRQFSIDQASFPWILVLMPGERLDSSLKSNLNRLMGAGFDVFFLPIKGFVNSNCRGRGREHFQPRFFKKEAIIWSQTKCSQPVFNTNRVARVNDGFILHSIDTDPKISEVQEHSIAGGIKEYQDEYPGPLEDIMPGKENPDNASGIKLIAPEDFNGPSFDLASYLKDLELSNPLMSDNEALYRFLHELSLS